MKAIKEIFNFRYYMLAVLSLSGLIGMFAYVDEDQCMHLSEMEWTLLFVATKIVGFGAFALFAKLFNKWEKAGKIPFVVNDVDDRI